MSDYNIQPAEILAIIGREFGEDQLYCDPARADVLERERTGTHYTLEEIVSAGRAYKKWVAWGWSYEATSEIRLYCWFDYFLEFTFPQLYAKCRPFGNMRVTVDKVVEHWREIVICVKLEAARRHMQRVAGE